MANYFGTLHDQNKAKTTFQSSPVFLNVSKKILARESIFRNVDCNIAHQLKKIPSFLTQQQIKMSSIYEQLFQRMQKAKKRQEQQKIDHFKRLEQISKDIKNSKQQIQECKVQMWELKNQILQLEQMLTQQTQQYNELCHQVQGSQEEDQSDQNLEYQDDSASENRNGNERSSQNPNQSKEEEYSKPSCSIKYFISNRSITSPNISKQALSVQQGRGLFSQSDNQEYTQIYRRENDSEILTQNNMLSFKKTQNAICIGS